MTLFSKIRARFHGASGRGKSVGLFFASSLLSRGVSTGCQLLQVPVAVKALGTEGFGLWISLISICYFITFADFGLGQSAQNKLSIAFAKQRPGEQQDLFVNAMAFLATMGALLFGLGYVVICNIDFTALFHIADPSVQAAAPGAVRAVLVIFCINFPLGLAQRLAYSRQKGWMHNIAQAAAGVASLVGVILVAHWKGGLVDTILAGQLPVAAANLVLLAIQCHQLGWLGRLRIRLRIRTVKQLLHLSGYFALQQVLTVVLFGLPQIVISTQLGVGAVTSYNLAQRLFNVFAILQNAFLLPLWPAYSDAAAQNDYRWVQKTLIRSIRATVVLSILPMIGLTLAAQPILRAWVGTHTELPSPSLIWLLFAWNCAVFIQQPFSFLLAGISEVRRTTIFSIIGTTVSAGLMYLLVSRFGQEGVVAGLIIGFVPFPLVGAILQTFEVFRRMDRSQQLAINEPLSRQAC